MELTKTPTVSLAPQLFQVARWSSVCALVCVLLGPFSVFANWHERSADAMGTRIHVELWHIDSAQAARALDRVILEMRRIDKAYSPYREDSELSELNRQAANGWMQVSAELFELLDRSAYISELTQGAFDVTYASAGRHYDYRKGHKPDSATLAASIALINYRYVELDYEQQSVRFSQPQVYVDLGGIAKGYAVDLAISLLQEFGVTQASVSAGGDSRILGDRQGQPWTVGVRHPRKEGEYAVLLPLENTAVSTSGDYERFFDKDGVRYHHILNPKTGESARGSLSVTILGDDAALTDALSTSVFVMGPERGIRLINEVDGIDAIVIDPQGNILYSNGLAGLGES